MIVMRRLLTLLLLLAALTMGAQTQDIRQYTDNRPVIIVCDWDYAPFEFKNSKGQSTGYHIDIINNILNQLNIPHKFVMTARAQSVEMFRNHEADLIFDYRSRFTEPEYCVSHSIFYYYKMAAVSQKGEPPFNTLKHLDKDDILVFNNNTDTTTYYSLTKPLHTDNYEFHTAREALAGVASGRYRYFVWGEETLKWKINELNLNNLEFSEVQLPTTEVHIVGHDRTLIREIDDQYARMEQWGEISNIYNKWFHPENLPSPSSNRALILVIASLLMVIVLFLIYHYTRSRVRKVIRKNEDMQAMMHQALNMSNYQVMVYNLKDEMVYNHHGNILPDEGMSWSEFFNHVHPDDQPVMLQKTKALIAGQSDIETVNLRWDSGIPGHSIWRDIRGHAFTEADINGQTQDVVITASDMTSEVQRDRNEQELANRYKKMFESTMIAMSFYDKNGNLVDLNDSMRRMCCQREEQEHFFRNLNMFDAMPVKNQYDPRTHTDFHTCHHMYYPEAGVDIYIEFRINPTFDEHDELLYYTVTARDITDERNTYLNMRQHAKALSEANAVNTIYEQKLQSLLESGNMYVWHADVKTGIITFSRSLLTSQFQETIDDYVDCMYEDEHEKARANIADVINNKRYFNVLRHFRHTPIRPTPSWFSVSGMPLVDDKGNLYALFGIIRDVSDLMKTLEKLRQETARAEDSGRQKSAFLANMTHEIRTPLNSIVGFSDLLPTINDNAERHEFIRIIRNNCDMLLRLINDIIEASTMDSNPLAINATELDFSAAFDDSCHTLAGRVQDPNVAFIADNPYKHFRTVLDKERMQQVITNFVTNAIKYTREGHIRVGYRYQDGGIYMYCEDTGAGIPKEKQASVFERFVKLNDFIQGSGLGLSICKSIATRCGGRIGVDSEGEGRGSTFWIWIPCEDMGHE